MHIPPFEPGFRAALTFILVAWLLPSSLPAALVDGLYEGRVPVASEGEADRGPAIGQALRQVLVKLSGVPQPAGPQVEAAVADPREFMQQFRYEESADPAMPYSLWVRFDSDAVDALVRDAGLPVWSAQRPGLLAWVAMDRQGALEVIAPEAGLDDGGLTRALVREAWSHGVPLGFPLLDLEDRVRVQPAVVWQQDMETIVGASRRYSPGALLVGRVQADAAGGAWVGRWRFEESGEVSNWEVAGPSPADTAAGVFARIAQRLAARYAVAAGQAEPGGVMVTVSGVRTLGDYARALEYLESLDQVSALEFSGVRGEEFTFRMQVRGGAGALRRLASFGGVLAAEPGGISEDASVRFRLLP